MSQYQEHFWIERQKNKQTLIHRTHLTMSGRPTNGMMNNYQTNNISEQVEELLMVYSLLRRNETRVYALLIDLSKACDHITHSWLFKSTNLHCTTLSHWSLFTSKQLPNQQKPQKMPSTFLQVFARVVNHPYKTFGLCHACF